MSWCLSVCRCLQMQLCQRGPGFFLALSIRMAVLDWTNITTVEVNVTTKDRHYLVVKVNVSDVHYYIVVKVNTFDFTFFILILMW